MSRKLLIFILLVCFGFTAYVIVKAQPRKIIVSDGKYSISFNIPRNWAAETRHSGEKPLSIEEMRAFLSTCRDGGIKVANEVYPDYCDQPLSKLRQLKPEEIKNMFYRAKNDWLPYPTASVADNKYISYSDTAWRQIDLYIFHDFSLLNNYFVQMLKDNRMTGIARSMCDIAQKRSMAIMFPLDKDDKGQPMATKMGTGGAIYYIPLNNKDMLVINKQAKGDKAFEEQFRSMLSSLRVNE